MSYVIYYFAKVCREVAKPMYDPFRLSDDHKLAKTEGGRDIKEAPWNHTFIPLHENQVKHERLPHLGDIVESSDPLRLIRDIQEQSYRNIFGNAGEWKSKENRDRGFEGLYKDDPLKIYRTPPWRKPHTDPDCGIDPRDLEI